MSSVMSEGVSLVIPAYNEELSIGKAIGEAIDALESLKRGYEVIVVDDGSRDRTAEIIGGFSGDLRVKVVRHSRNLGYGASLRDGFRAASLYYVAYTDADMQFDVRELGGFIDEIRNCDIVCGYRAVRNDNVLRRIISRGYTSVIKFLFGLDLQDIDCSMKLFRRSALGDIELKSRGFLIDLELVYKLKHKGCRIREIPVSHHPRLYGKSSVSIKSTVETIVSLILLPVRGWS